jgi:hypothetical protein
MPGGYFLAGRTSQNPVKRKPNSGELRIAEVQLPRKTFPRGIPAPDCARANSRESCEVPSVWCTLREGSRFLLVFAPLVLTSNAQPLRCFGPKHISAKGHPTGSCLLQKLRARRAVEDADNLIRYAPRASSGSVHTLAPDDKRAAVPKSKETPTTGGAKCGLARTGGDYCRCRPASYSDPNKLPKQRC